MLRGNSRSYGDSAEGRRSSDTEGEGFAKLTLQDSCRKYLNGSLVSVRPRREFVTGTFWAPWSPQCSLVLSKACEVEILVLYLQTLSPRLA